MTFNDIFKSSFLNNIAEFSIVDTLIGLLFALALGLFIFIVYKKTFSGIMYSTGFALTLPGQLRSLWRSFICSGLWRWEL